MRLIELYESEQLPNNVIEAFEDVGKEQRNKPEIFMTKLQEFLGGGMLSYLIEHVGDLSHRMTHMAKYNYFGYNEVKEKIDNIKRKIDNIEQLTNEVKQNTITNAKYKEVDLERFKNAIDTNMNKYAQLHDNITVYNELQNHSKQAAVSLGYMHFHSLKKHIDAIDQFLINEETFNKKASEYDLINDRPKVYYS